MANKPNNPTAFRANNIQVRLRKIQQARGMADTTRQLLQSQFEAACLYWFLEAGGVESEFNAKFHSEKKNESTNSHTTQAHKGF